MTQRAETETKYRFHLLWPMGYRVVFVSRPSTSENECSTIEVGDLVEMVVMANEDQPTSLDPTSCDAIILDDSVIGYPYSESLHSWQRRSQGCAVLVGCRADRFQLVSSVLEIDEFEWIQKPYSSEAIALRLRRLHNQRRVRDELQDSLLFIRRVADASPEMLYIFDIDSCQSIYVNRQTCAMLGCGPNGIVPVDGMYFHSVAYSEDIPNLNLDQKYARASDEDVIHAEFRINDAKGCRWIHSREIVFHRNADGSPSQILGTAQDISDRKALDTTRNMLASIVANSDDAIIGKSLEGEIRSWNLAAQRLYGYTENEIIGRNISVLVPPNAENEIPQLLAQIKAGHCVDHYQTTRRCKDGEFVAVSVTISPIKESNGTISGASTIARRL